MRIDVTAAQLHNGKPRSCGYCPVALALGAATGQDWLVLGDFAQLWGGGPKMYLLPPAVRLMIRRIDAEKPVEPFSFDIDIDP